MARNNILIAKRHRSKIDKSKQFLFTGAYLLGKLMVEKDKRITIKSIKNGIVDGFKTEVTLYEK